ncbi:MAG: coproporphyrinogen III oxidase, partial [Alphaproteobacteria bacterium]|nr:coproporphyrinogen III oxidase [Alphaproteobacteria bacterium]
MTAAAVAPAPAAEDDRGFALYVHWPFCRSKCPYCDFNSHVREIVDHPRWRAALLAELDHVAAETNGRRLDSIFFGGGTPSLMDPATVAAVIDRATTRWRPAQDLEITLEANPTSAEAERFAGFRAAGVNRVSLGVQALDDAALRFLGREHSAAEALAAVGLARRHFDRLSFDLIYARPGQTPAAWADELGRALDHAVGHLSVYQLTIERGTAFESRVRRGVFVPPDDDAAGDLWDTTQDVLDAAGLPAYETSNHARPGEACRHNLVYWRTGDYAGIGPGAHGRLTLDGTRWATRTHRAPEIWLERVEAAGHGEHPREAVAPRARAEETLMMGLRLAEGVPLARIEADADRPWTEVVDAGAARAL